MPPILDKHESAMAKICIIGISGFGRAHYDYLLEAVNGGRAEAVAARQTTRSRASFLHIGAILGNNKGRGSAGGKLAGLVYVRS